MAHVLYIGLCAKAAFYELCTINYVIEIWQSINSLIICDILLVVQSSLYPDDIRSQLLYDICIKASMAFPFSIQICVVVMKLDIPCLCP